MDDAGGAAPTPHIPEQANRSCGERQFPRPHSIPFTVGEYGPHEAGTNQDTTSWSDREGVRRYSVILAADPVYVPVFSEATLPF
jgi:hypothetical protein